LLGFEHFHGVLPPYPRFKSSHIAWQFLKWQKITHLGSLKKGCLKSFSGCLLLPSRPPLMQPENI
jgi:hypothetical protein